MSLSFSQEHVFGRPDLILAEYGLHVEKLKRSGSQLMACCPFHDDSTPSLSINPDTGEYCCHGCKATGDLPAFLAHVRNIPLADAMDDLRQRHGLKANGNGSGGSTRPAPPLRAVPAHDPETYWTSLAATDTEGIAYLEGRKLWPLPEDAVRFLPADDYRIAFRLYDAENHLVNVQRKPITDPGDKPRMLGIQGASVRGSSIGPLPAAGAVWLVEGVTDWLAALLLVPALGLVPVGVPGASNAEALIAARASALKGRRVFVSMDNDETGRRAEADAVAALSATGAVAVLARYPEGFKDLAEIVEKLGPDAAREVMAEVMKPAPDPNRLVVSWDEYQDESYPPVPSLWGDALLVKAGGYLIVGGDTGVGKTILVSNLVLGLADARESFLGFSLPGRPVPVLFLEAEGSRQLFRDRLRQIAKGLGVRASGLPIFFHKANAQLAIADQSFRQMVVQSGAEVVFLDPIGRFHDGEEKDAGEWRARVTEPLAEISRELRVAFVFADHYNKPREGQSGSHKIRGTPAKIQDCGAAMRLEIGKAGGASRVLYFDRIRDGALPFPEKDPCRMPLEINLTAGTIVHDEREGADAVGGVREGRIIHVVEYVRERGPHVRTADLHSFLKDECELEKSRANDLIAAAVANGAIERVGKGTYRLPGDFQP